MTFEALSGSVPFTFIVEADGPIRAAELVTKHQKMRVLNVEPLRRKGTSVQRVRGGWPLWEVTAIDLD